MKKKEKRKQHSFLQIRPQVKYGRQATEIQRNREFCFQFGNLELEIFSIDSHIVNFTQVKRTMILVTIVYI